MKGWIIFRDWKRMMKFSGTMPGSSLMLTRTGNFLDWSGQEIGPGFMNWW